MNMVQLKCADMKRQENKCESEVTHIDSKGFVYCEYCGKVRKLYSQARRLQPRELKLLWEGKPLEKY